MAAVTRTDLEGGGYIYTATLTTADDTSDPIKVPNGPDKCVQFDSGAWGAATAALEGSIDGTTYLPLTDPQGNAIAKTANGIEQVIENPVFIRMRLSVVGIGATVNARLYVRRP